MDYFVHHHVHSFFSELDGLRSPEKIAQTVADMGQPGISITDHGSMAGIPSMYRAAKEHGLMFTPGIESYWAIDRTQKSPDLHGQKYYHLTLLAHSWEGYQALIQQQVEAWKTGFYYKPRIDAELLEQYPGDLTVLTGCLGSASSQAILRSIQRGMSDDEIINAAADAISVYTDILGKDRVMVEVHNHGIYQEELILPYQVKVAKKMGLPLIAANDTHYCTEEDADYHDYLLCSQTHSKVDDRHRFRMDDRNKHGHIEEPHYFLTSRAQMEKLFPADMFPGALDNTVELAERSHFEMPMGDKMTYLMPKADIPEGMTEKEQLRKLVMEGAHDPTRYGRTDGTLPEEVQERIDYELGIIDRMKFNGYFLIVRKIIDIVNENNITLGPGRGSAPGSIVSYCLGITQLDPLEHNLYFERFLNPDRVSMPDIDTDIDQADRQRLLGLIQDYFGEGHVAHISNYSMLENRSAISTVVRSRRDVFLPPKPIADAFMDWIESKDLTLQEAYDEIKEKGRVPSSVIGKLKELMGQRYKGPFPSAETLADVLRIAAGVSGTLNTFGIHACGIIITDTPLSDVFPLRWKQDTILPICQYDKNDCEALGAVKMDILGLNNLHTCVDTENKILRDLGEVVHVDQIHLNDPDTYKMLAKGDSSGVFQLESDGMKQLLKELKPTQFTDISACVALYRPGPMGMNAHMSFAHRKNGLEDIDVPHPDMGKILHETYGLCLDGSTEVYDVTNHRKVSLANLYKELGDGPSEPVSILSCDTGSEDNDIIASPVEKIWVSGIKDVFHVELDNGFSVIATEEHPLLTRQGWVSVGHVKPGETEVAVAKIHQYGNCDVVSWVRVKAVRFIHKCPVYDIEVAGTHTLLVNEGIVVSNCIYQEQIMGLAQHYAGYTAAEADNLRKAMAKKNAVMMEENRRKFIPAVDKTFPAGTGQKLWDIVAPFSSYAFCRCMAGDTQVMISPNKTMSVEKLFHHPEYHNAVSLDGDGVFRRSDIRRIVMSGEKPLYTLVTESGKKIRVTENHRMLTTHGYGSVFSGLHVGTRLISYDPERFSDEVRSRRIMVSSDTHSRNAVIALICQYCEARGVPYFRDIPVVNHEGDMVVADFKIGNYYLQYDPDMLGEFYWEDTKYGTQVSLKCFGDYGFIDVIDEVIVGYPDFGHDKIVEIIPPELDENGEPVTEPVYDVEMAVTGPMNFVANGLVSHNSHAAAYAIVSYRTAWLKCHYPAQFAGAVLDLADRPKYRDHIHWIARSGITINLPDVNKSGMDVITTEDSITIPLTMIEKYKTKAQIVVGERQKNGPFSSITDLVARCGLTVPGVLPLIKAGALDSLHNRGAMLCHVYDIVAASSTISKQQTALSTGLFALAGLDNMVDTSVETELDIDLNHYPSEDGVTYDGKNWSMLEEDTLYRQLETEMLGFGLYDTTDYAKKVIGRVAAHAKDSSNKTNTTMFLVTPRTFFSNIENGRINRSNISTVGIGGYIYDIEVKKSARPYTVMTIMGPAFQSCKVAISGDLIQNNVFQGNPLYTPILVTDISRPREWRFNSNNFIWVNTVDPLEDISVF